MKIYGLIGKKKAGKDLFAKISLDYLKNFVACKAAFADALKTFVVEYLGVSSGNYFGTQEDKAKIIGKYSDYFSNRFCYDIDVNPNDIINGRTILQLVGTEIFRRNFKETIWVDILINRLKERLPNDSIIFITDVRFKNEMDAIKKECGKIIRLYRYTDDEFDSHASEKEMDLIQDNEFDYIIQRENNINSQQLENEVKRILRSEKLL